VNVSPERARAARAGPAADAPLTAAAVLRHPIQAWLHGRLRRTESLKLTQRNIYILPTRAGLMFAATLGMRILPHPAPGAILPQAPKRPEAG